MKIATIGLGLIGGSLAKTIKYNTSYTVLGYDISNSVVEKALKDRSIDELTEDFSDCDIILISLYPEDTIKFLKKNINQFKAGSLVIDCCGVKEIVCNAAKDIFSASRSCFIGGHPMAGREFSGYDYSTNNLFINASMILTPINTTPNDKLEDARDFFSELNFKKITITTPQHHDQVIAYTSQLAHIVSNSFVQSPTANNFSGFSAGSFADLTRVALLNPDMWSELFLSNSDALVYEINLIVNTLERFKFFLENGKEQELKNLLQHGSDIKENLNNKKE